MCWIHFQIFHRLSISTKNKRIFHCLSVYVNSTILYFKRQNFQTKLQVISLRIPLLYGIKCIKRTFEGISQLRLFKSCFVFSNVSIIRMWIFEKCFNFHKLLQNPRPLFLHLHLIIISCYNYYDYTFLHFQRSLKTH